MKKLEAIIRPERLTDTIKGLRKIGITGFTVSQVVGRGKQKDTQGVYRGKNYQVTLHPKVKLEIVLSDYMVEPTIKKIFESAQTGEDGDGKIYVYPILEAYNIRTGKPDFDIDDLLNQEGGLS
ncbi:P-II family nitrogen regulator [Bacillus methanolicus]|uniref:Nitrogen regulatory protein P-II n=1 Tax=Bacillus methanolicus (strain MGA3 / ATCC 53907) TaxID=796606 RepID=I3E927_BACMM|nr:P-II family nitrogen regulator [Bacillus methanolicus]AIE60256.1 nitrogen regulatory protein P-II [Bacillus methanolicus MGA3]EIJ82998.1 nitrogen regulatory protein P-II [Bacillus methanolicus MGA3]UQD52248.1 P-II family nitrogen regulator [Bacillus methanolicus]